MPKLWQVENKKTVGNKKLYHIFMHRVLKKIENQQSRKLSITIFLKVLLLKVDLAILMKLKLNHFEEIKIENLEVSVTQSFCKFKFQFYNIYLWSFSSFRAFCFH